MRKSSSQILLTALIQTHVQFVVLTFEATDFFLLTHRDCIYALVELSLIVSENGLSEIHYWRFRVIDCMLTIDFKQQVFQICIWTGSNNTVDATWPLY